MKRIGCPERVHWRAFAEEVGFGFHTINEEPYWNESAYYQFRLQQIECDLEGPTEELHEMILDMVGDITYSEEMLTQLNIPHDYWSYVWNSWNDREPHLYGRMDFAYHGVGPAKLLELNYDTPTSVFETGFFQWVWLEEQMQAGVLPAEADQFNSLQDKLEQAFRELILPNPFYFSSAKESAEDKGTVHYLMDLATQSGVDARYVAIEDIGEIDGQMVDLDNVPIAGLFKLYPWEFMVQDEFARVLYTSRTKILEPGWKMLLSNKGILPLLWQRYPDHPNLLPAFFEDEANTPLNPGWVRKPLLSREGANIQLVDREGQRHEVDGPYGKGGFIRQEFSSLPKFFDEKRGQDIYALVGSWLVGDCAAGIGIREDSTLITKDSSRFVPHIILD